MASEELVNQIMSAVMKKLDGGAAAAPAAAPAGARPATTEFVGASAIGDTIGLVIANVDPQIHALMKIDPKYKSIGIVGARTGAGPHIFAADEAVKATNTEIVAIELPRDTK
ncbi:MAG: propanediol utilization microcompartment protein PduB, partial [Propionicimonas sp.]|nr:propanediol utilization microcompartment protein PduB [Propionicimonas sp.]